MPGVVDQTTGLAGGSWLARQNWMPVLTAGAGLGTEFAKSRLSAQIWLRTWLSEMFSGPFWWTMCTTIGIVKLGPAAVALGVIPLRWAACTNASNSSRRWASEGSSASDWASRASAAQGSLPGGAPQGESDSACATAGSGPRATETPARRHAVHAKGVRVRTRGSWAVVGHAQPRTRAAAPKG